MGNLLITVLRQWIPLAVVLSIFFPVFYLAIQQEIRMSANDPQIQIAEDTAAKLNNHQTIMLSNKIDISQSLSSFTIIYDTQGSVLQTSATLNGQQPIFPLGALHAAKDQGENRLTWEPQPGVRLATVVSPFNNGYVVVGRNMREIEKRENKQLHIMLLGYLTSLVGTFLSVFVMNSLLSEKK